MVEIKVNDTVQTALLSETELLIQAARLIDKDDIALAIQLLEQAHRETARSERVLSTLSRLHQRLGNNVKAKEYIEAVSYDSPASTIHSEIELPNESDVAFLADKSNELMDIEYNFESSSPPPKKSPRKTLRLKRNLSSKSVEVKNKAALRSKKKDVSLNYSYPFDDINVPVNSSLPKDKTEAKKPNSSKSKSDLNESLIELQCELNESLVQGLGNDVVEDLGEYYDIFNEEDTENDISVDIFIYTEEVTPEEDIYLSDSNELELYDLWIDDDQVNCEDVNVETGALENSLSVEERARFVAVDSIIDFGWHARELPFLTDVFTGPGWKNTKIALLREVQSGASVEELKLAFDVKEFWKESPRYWITFSKAWVSGESTDATYKNCSWKQALRLVRLFDGVPTFEEIYYFLESEFEYWYENSHLRRCFPAFNHYLFRYLLQRRSIDFMLGRFATVDFFDGLDAISSDLTLSDEILLLQNMGIDLSSKFVIKNSFVSDNYTNEYLLELWNQT